MNLPNSLTILRIFFVPLLVVVLLTRQPNWDFCGMPVHFEVWGVLILLAAAATDAMDGYYRPQAREVTTLGILLDPIADKLLISAAFISLVQMGLVPGVDGGDHHRPRIHGARPARNRFGRRFDDSRLALWQDENGSAGDRRLRRDPGAPNIRR